jgi:hypothetical protein
MIVSKLVLIRPEEKEFQASSSRALKITYPGNRISKDEETGKADHRNRRFRSQGRIISVETEVANRGEDQEADHHPSAAAHEGLAPAKVLYNVETKEGTTEVDTIENHLSDE